MELNDYQKKAMTTCMDSCHNFSYMFINLVGEVGEFASKVAKQIRKGNMAIGSDGIFDHSDNDLYYQMYEMPIDESIKFNNELRKEAGDILWQLSGLCKIMGWSLEEVAQANLDKLAARKAAGTIDGSGDGIDRPK